MDTPTRRASALIGVVAIAAAWLPPAEASPQDAELIYVTSQAAAAVSVIDTRAQEVVHTIDLQALGFTANCKPHHVAVEPDGSYFYVSLIADWRVLKFDRDNRLVGQVEFETPGLMALDPRSDTLYVGRSMAAVSPPMRIGVVDRANMKIDEVDVFFARPHAIMAARQDGVVWTASLAENRIAAVQPAQENIELVDVPGETHTFVQFALSPDGSTLVSGGQISGDIMVWDVSHPMKPELRHRFHIGGQPWHPVFSPDDSVVYFPQRTANAVAIIDAREWKLADQITGGGLFEPHGSGLTADGRWLYVSGRNTAGEWGDTPDGATPPGTVNIIDTRSSEVVKVLEVPPYAAGIGTRAR